LFTILYKQADFFIPADLAIIVQVAVATIISIGFYKWIEKPLIQTPPSPKEMIKSSAKGMIEREVAPDIGGAIINR
jgi:peptidoglycan/LPS O-acetylase OafA/YrhL